MLIKNGHKLNHQYQYELKNTGGCSRYTWAHKNNSEKSFHSRYTRAHKNNSEKTFKSTWYK